MNTSDSIFEQMNNFNENLIANIQGGVITCQLDPQTGISKAIYISEGWTKLTGYSLTELNEQFDGNPQALIFPEDAILAGCDYIEQTRYHNNYQLQYRIRHKDGRLIWTIDRGVITATSEGINQNQSIITDITPMKENEERVRMSEALFRIATKASQAAVFEFDISESRYSRIENTEVIFRANAQSIIEAVETAKQKIGKFTLEDVVRVLYHHDDIPLIMLSYENIIKNGISECEARIRQPDGSFIWCKIHKIIVNDEKGNAQRIIGHIINIDEQRKKTDQLLREAQSDALTGVYNKNAVKDIIESSLHAAPQLIHTLLVLDIDNFKGVNDKLGHLFGDAVLIDVSSKLKRLFRRDGVIGRIGGDEFIVLLKDKTCNESISERAESICHAFRHTYSGEKADYKISCSVGVALSSQDDTFNSLFRKADIALYQAKNKGKDQYVMFTDSINEKTATENVPIQQNDMSDSGKLKIKERIFELLYGSVDFAGSVNMILSLLGQLLEVSRIYIFENTPDNRFSSNIYEWCAEGIASNMSNTQHLAIEELNYFSQFDESGICRCWNTATLQNPLRSVYEKNGIRSTFQVAIIENGIICGFMGYDSLDKPISQSSEQVDIMIFAAKVTGTFIIKKRADEKVKLFNQNKMVALDSLPSAIYVIDEQYQLQYMNNTVSHICPDVKIGQKCYEVFMHNTSPCTQCPASCCKDAPCTTEIYNPHTNIWMLSTASVIKWSGHDNMRLLCCQIINQYKQDIKK